MISGTRCIFATTTLTGIAGGGPPAGAAAAGGVSGALLQAEINNAAPIKATAVRAT